MLKKLFLILDKIISRVYKSTKIKWYIAKNRLRINLLELCGRLESWEKRTKLKSLFLSREIFCGLVAFRSTKTKNDEDENYKAATKRCGNWNNGIALVFLLFVLKNIPPLSRPLLSFFSLLFLPASSPRFSLIVPF